MQHHLLPAADIQYDDGGNSSYDAFFREVPLPFDINASLPDVKHFVEHCIEVGKKLVVITSGGTIVPLEHNMVRYLDNFSGGGRGAASAEYLIDKGYAVVLLYRKNSLQPYVRHCMQHGTNFFEFLEAGPDGQAHIVPKHANEVNQFFTKYVQALKDKMLFRLSFLGVGEYLYLLRAISKIVSLMGPRAMIYSAGAISDFYIPVNQMQLHKIQSSGAGLDMHLTPVPKMLKPLSSVWCPNAFIISFKLETDDAVLEDKSRASLQAYQHQLVIGNMLASYRDKVIFFQQEQAGGRVILRNDLVDIEVAIVNDMVELHEKFLTSKQ